MNISALILAGGKSKRMGTDKALLEIQGVPMVMHIARQLLQFADEVIVNANEIERYAFTGLQLVSDEQPGMGPLAGILSGLRKASHEKVFVTACDIPEISVSYVRALYDRSHHADIVMPQNDDNTVEPLFALYSRGLVQVIERVLARGLRKVTDVCDEPGVRTVYVSMQAADGWYKNLNTPEDFGKYVSSRC